ncbi:MAG: hypothetical protein ACOC2L_04505 [Candidatus Sumerlaeota bacterium]
MASPRRMEKLRQGLLGANWYAVPPETLLPRCRPCSGETVDLALSLPDQPTLAAAACFFRYAATTIAVVEIETDAGRQDLYNQFLDFTLIERLLLWGFARDVSVQFIVVTSEADRAVIIDTEMESVRAQGAELEEVPGLLESMIGQPESMDVRILGEELQQWIGLMAGQVGPPLKWARPESTRLVHQLLLGCKVMLNKPDGPAYLGLRISDAPEKRNIKWQTVRPDNRLAPLLEAAAAHAPEGAGAFGPLERKALNRQIAETDGLDIRAMLGLVQLSSSKLRAEVQLPALLTEENEHKSWKLALTDPLLVENLLENKDLYVFHPLTIDLEESGVGRAWEAIEKLAAHALQLDEKIARSGGRQLDFFEKNPEGLSKSERLEDPFGWLCRHALRIKLGESQNKQIVAYLVASFIADLQTRTPFNQSRPKPLRSLPHLFQVNK